LTGPKTAVLTARVDLDGDGRVAGYRLDLNAEGMLGESRGRDGVY
jgi:hypothetical protein